MANPSPTKFPSMDDPEVVAVREALQLSAYACLDDGLSKQERFAKSCSCSRRAMEVLCRTTRLKKAAEKRLALLTAELNAKKKKLEEAYSRIEVLEASEVFLKDDIPEQTETSTQTDGDLGELEGLCESEELKD